MISVKPVGVDDECEKLCKAVWSSSALVISSTSPSKTALLDKPNAGKLAATGRLVFFFKLTS